MANPVEIELVIVEPVELVLDVAPSTFIGTAQAGPTGPTGPIGNLENMPYATQSVSGLVKLASQVEVTAGVDTTKAVVPGTLKSELDKKAQDEIPTLKLIFENNLI